MMHMDDCLAATWALMSAPKASLSRTTYNVTAVSFTPAALAEAIARRLPGFRIEYQPDFRCARCGVRWCIYARARVGGGRLSEGGRELETWAA